MNFLTFLKRDERRRTLTGRSPGAVLFIAIFAALLIAFPESAVAASGGHHGHGEEAPLPSLSGMLYEKRIYWINFLIYTILLFLVIRRPFLKAWGARRVAYMEAINSGRILLLESEQKLLKAKQLLATLPAESAELRKRLEKETEFESQRILKEASERAQKIKNQASQSVAVEKRSALVRYEEKLIELAISRARANMPGLISEDVEARLRDRAVGSVQGLLQ